MFHREHGSLLVLNETSRLGLGLQGETGLTWGFDGLSSIPIVGNSLFSLFRSSMQGRVRLQDKKRLLHPAGGSCFQAILAKSEGAVSHFSEQRPGVGVLVRFSGFGAYGQNLAGGTNLFLRP